MSSRKGRGQKAPALARHRKITRLAAQLAPLEEHVGLVTQRELSEGEFVDGSIIVDDQALPHINPLEEDGDASGLRIEPVVRIVTALALAFTAFIAYLIASQDS